MLKSDPVVDLKKAYASCFGSGPGEIVYRDLQKLYDDALSFYPEQKAPIDPVKAVAVEAQRQVFIRIKQMVDAGEKITLKPSLEQQTTQTHAETDLPQEDS